MIAEAQQRSRSLLAEAEARKREIVMNIQGDRDQLLFEVDSLERQYRHMISRMRDVAEEQLSLVASLDRSEAALELNEANSVGGRRRHLVPVADPTGMDDEAAEAPWGIERR